MREWTETEGGGGGVMANTWSDWIDGGREGGSQRERESEGERERESERERERERESIF